MPVDTWFVYVPGLKGPIAEKWPFDKPPPIAGEPQVLMRLHLQPDEVNLPISELERRFPYKEFAK